MLRKNKLVIGIVMLGFFASPFSDASPCTPAMRMSLENAARDKMRAQVEAASKISLDKEMAVADPNYGKPGATGCLNGLMPSFGFGFGFPTLNELIDAGKAAACNAARSGVQQVTGSLAQRLQFSMPPIIPGVKGVTIGAQVGTGGTASANVNGAQVATGATGAYNQAAAQSNAQMSQAQAQASANATAQYQAAAQAAQAQVPSSGLQKAVCFLNPPPGGC